MRIFKNISKIIDDFINPKCPNCGMKLTKEFIPIGLEPEPIYICKTKDCKGI